MSKFVQMIAVQLALGGAAMPASADDPPTTHYNPIEFSVLTPGLEGHFHVLTGYDLSMIGIAGLSDMARTKTLRKLIEDAGYDPTPRIVDAILAALHDAGRTGIYEPIPRQPEGRLQSLSADDLPLAPKGALLLDITINWIALRADVSLDTLKPAFSLTWRLISPDGKLVAPGRVLRYVHESERKKPKIRDPALRPKQKTQPAAAPPEPEAPKFCSFSTLTAVQKDPAALWNCFDEAYLAAARKIVEQLPKKP